MFVEDTGNKKVSATKAKSVTEMTPPETKVISMDEQHVSFAKQKV